jgi:hypothetical protein
MLSQIGSQIFAAFQSLSRIKESVRRNPANPLTAVQIETVMRELRSAGEALEDIEREGIIAPLVIIEGRGMSSVEAILVNKANCLFVDWDHIGSDKEKALEVFEPIVYEYRSGSEDHTDSPPSRPDRRIGGL